MAIAIIRTLILYAAIVVSLRIMGKRQLGELEPAELVVAVLISDLAAHPLQDIGTPLLYGLIPVLTLLCCEVLITAGVVKSIRFRAFICGKPNVIIHQGKIIQKEMKKNRMTPDELSEQLRKKNIVDISTVKYGILETDGTLSTVLYTDQAPLTPKQMNLPTNDVGYPVIVINNGRVISDNLQKMGFNEVWLKKQLKNRNIAAPRDVYLMTVDESSRIYFAVKDNCQ
ncbi:Uncharacterized membrane protein YcaP, DUF421 family [Sporobacter termitidis DSM 10068]|uniref:Uncharacterized membrane protein YcaP, DUF421 family n=1 Tax=Sporobacter termitidis DSM 10068 TaxID=1123282 RepID=A0A1M5TTZ1_9FIRM|nr:DUF421 domain-containing protein [Sporobacter termitidis]SHH53873.1 Uncharacterized membrane protein YcaP, DUF421 family [Sporobacter termitidis DSM 10068]